MNRAAPCLLMLLSAVAVNGFTASWSQAEDKSVKTVQEWRGKFAKQEDEPLMKVAPRSGYIANEKAWAKLWKAWRGKEELPKVDFEEQLVLVGTTEGSSNDVGAEFQRSEEGDLRGGFPVSNIRGAGFAYLIVVVDRAGVKTYNGKAIEKE